MERRAVRVFLDSNVVLSGLFSDKGAPRIILDIFCLDIPNLAAVTGEYNLIEIERNIRKKMPDVLPLYRDFLARIDFEVVPLPGKKDIKKFAGHIADKDVPVIVSAINGRADFLVTGDKKDFAKLKGKGGYPFRVMDPSEFLYAIIPGIIGE